MHYKNSQHNEPTQEELNHRAKYWAIGNNILEKMRKENHYKWDVKRKPKQSKLF